MAGSNRTTFAQRYLGAPAPNNSLANALNRLTAPVAPSASPSNSLKAIANLLVEAGKQSDPAVRVYGNELAGYRWRLKAGNHEITASGESYTRREDAVRGVRRVAELLASSPIVFD